MLEGKIGEGPFFRVQSGKIIVCTLTYLTGKQGNVLLPSLELLRHVEVEAGMRRNIWLRPHAGVPLHPLGNHLLGVQLGVDLQLLLSSVDHL